MSDTTHSHGKIIGVMGRKHSGKDAVAQAIIEVDKYKWERVAFADPMKEMAVAMDVVIEVLGRREQQLFCGDFEHDHTPTYFRLAAFVKHHGWEKAKQCDDVRRFLQRLGTEGGRKCIYEDVWVDRTFQFDVIPFVNAGVSVVIPDTRFSNEIEAVQNAGGELWRVERPGLADDGDKHVSEHEWRSVTPDRLILNDGTLADLNDRVREILWAR